MITYEDFKRACDELETEEERAERVWRARWLVEMVEQARAYPERVLLELTT